MSLESDWTAIVSDIKHELFLKSNLGLFGVPEKGIRWLCGSLGAIHLAFEVHDGVY